MEVGDQFRKNPLSHRPGGSVIELIFKEGYSRIYDKIKSPSAYIAKLDLSKIQTIIVDGREVKIVN